MSTCHERLQADRWVPVSTDAEPHPAFGRFGSIDRFRTPWERETVEADEFRHD